jgi:hypothetical protein
VDIPKRVIVYIMNNEEKTRYFIDLYMIALRAFYNNDFLRPPTPTSERFSQLDRARIIVDEVGGEYGEYIRLQFETYKKFRTAPTPAHMISLNAIKRYRAWQKKYNKFNTKEYTTNGDSFVVSKTRKTYPMAQVLLPVSQDTDALTAFSILEVEDYEGLPEATRDKYAEALYYLEAKLRYKGAIVPQSIKDVMEKIDPYSE